MLRTKSLTVFTKEICDFCKKHPNAYVLDENLKEDIDVPPNSFLFEILDEDDINVGFLLLIKKYSTVQVHHDYEYEYEIEIGIFDHPSVKRSYATECLQAIDCLVLSNFEEKLPVVALVRHKNEMKSKMESILLDSFFNKIDAPIKEGVLYVLKQQL